MEEKIKVENQSIPNLKVISKEDFMKELTGISSEFNALEEKRPEKETEKDKFLKSIKETLEQYPDLKETEVYKNVEKTIQEVKQVKQEREEKELEKDFTPVPEKRKMSEEEERELFTQLLRDVENGRTRGDIYRNLDKAIELGVLKRLERKVPPYLLKGPYFKWGRETYLPEKGYPRARAEALISNLIELSKKVREIERKQKERILEEYERIKDSEVNILDLLLDKKKTGKVGFSLDKTIEFNGRFKRYKGVLILEARRIKGGRKLIFLKATPELYRRLKQKRPFTPDLRNTSLETRILLTELKREAEVEEVRKKLKELKVKKQVAERK